MNSSRGIVTSTSVWHRVLGSLLAILLMSAATVCAAVSDQRDAVRLDGGWTTAVTRAEGDTAPAEGWTEINLPQITWLRLEQPGRQFAWYRRDVTIPSDWADRRIFIDVRSARYNPHVYVDGKLIGSQMDGWSPLEVEITEVAQPGQTHRLEIRCQDRTAVFPDDFAFKPGMSQQDLRGKTIAPVGGYKDIVGPSDPIWLKSTPINRVPAQTLEIVPSTRKNSLMVNGSVDGEGKGLKVEARVLDGEKDVLQLGPAAVDGKKNWSLTKAFPNARTWSPEDPHLYTLQITVRDEQGAVADQREIPFGFKEFWTDGPDFYLNGVKRHLLGTSTWPITAYEDLETIKSKLQAMKDAGANTFRTHIGPWQEEWLTAADQVGMMIIGESAVYTDGEGFYGYNDDRFWQNYRDHLEGMIRRDRNHASLIMWSLGNEILFMGNQRYAEDLPQKLGALATFAKKIDPQHPVTFEADLDPAGAYDVIGLHYPHELPNQHAYPNVADWLGDRNGKLTEAAGGMLGQQRSQFQWDRTKPLYIGEYLWVPTGDFGAGTVYFGDDAYQNREQYHDRAKHLAWYDQTIAYRRANVSGLCPWTPFGFGGVIENRDGVDMQQEYYRRVAAFPHSRDTRLVAGKTLAMSFDVFNDTPQPQDLQLTLTNASDGSPIVSQSLRLDAGGYQLVTVNVPSPAVSEPTDLPIEAVLSAQGREAHRASYTLRVEPRMPWTAPEGHDVVVYDPGNTWPNAAESLGGLASADAERTILLIAPGALTPPQPKDAGDLPVVGAQTFDTGAFLGFVTRGGHAIVLEQETLSPLGLDLSLVEHASTMTFPLSMSHPLLAGLTAEDLKFWRGDHYVARKQIGRPDAGGARAIVVSGGPRSLDQAPIVEMPVGQGSVLLIQALVGEKHQTEPAAQRILQNALNQAAAGATVAGEKTPVISDNAAFTNRLNGLGVAVNAINQPLAPSDLSTELPLILHGGGDLIEQSASAIAGFARNGGTVYWHAPDPETYERVRGVLNLSGLKMEMSDSGIAMNLRDHPLMQGVAREDLTWTSAPRGWDRVIDLYANAANRRFVPESTGSGQPQVFDLANADVVGATAGEKGLTFDRRGTVTVRPVATTAGLYPLIIKASGTSEAETFPLLRVDANGSTVATLALRSTDPQELTALLPLPAGTSDVTVRFVNGSEWGGGRALTIHELSVQPCVTYPEGAAVLVLPAAVVRVPVGSGQIVLDGTRWDAPGDNAVRGGRYASALLNSLGAAFTAPEAGSIYEPVPLTTFQLIGESPYFEARPDELLLRSNGTVQSTIYVADRGIYSVRVEASSLPVKNKFSMMELVIDGKPVGETEIASRTTRAFVVGRSFLAPGRHTIGLRFTNDAAEGDEDRNLSINAVALQQR